MSPRSPRCLPVPSRWGPPGPRIESRDGVLDAAQVARASGVGRASCCRRGHGRQHDRPADVHVLHARPARIRGERAPGAGVRGRRGFRADGRDPAPAGQPEHAHTRGQGGSAADLPGRRPPRGRRRRRLRQHRQPPAGVRRRPHDLGRAQPRQPRHGPGRRGRGRPGAGAAGGGAPGGDGQRDRLRAAPGRRWELQRSECPGRDVHRGWARASAPARRLRLCDRGRPDPHGRTGHPGDVPGGPWPDPPHERQLLPGVPRRPRGPGRRRRLLAARGRSLARGTRPRDEQRPRGPGRRRAGRPRRAAERCDRRRGPAVAGAPARAIPAKHWRGRHAHPARRHRRRRHAPADHPVGVGAGLG